MNSHDHKKGKILKKIYCLLALLFFVTNAYGCYSIVVASAIRFKRVSVIPDVVLAELTKIDDVQKKIKAIENALGYEIMRQHYEARGTHEELQYYKKINYKHENLVDIILNYAQKEVPTFDINAIVYSEVLNISEVLNVFGEDKINIHVRLLDLASCFGRNEHTYALLKHGANPNLKGNKGWTPFMMFVSKTTETLTQKKVAQEEDRSANQTALFFLDCGADPMIRNDENKDTFDVVGTPFVLFMRHYLYEKLMKSFNFMQSHRAKEQEFGLSISSDLALFIGSFEDPKTSDYIQNESLWEKVFPKTIKAYKEATNKKKFDMLQGIESVFNVQSAENQKKLLFVLDTFYELFAQGDAKKMQRVVGVVDSYPMLLNRVELIKTMMEEVIAIA